LRCSLPAPPKFVDQFHHGSHQTVRRNQIRPSIKENTRLMWWFRSSLGFRGESIGGFLNRNHTRMMDFECPFESEIREKGVAAM
jgi:hypothetical protein